MYNREYMNTHIFKYHIYYIYKYMKFKTKMNIQYIHIRILHTFISPVKCLLYLF